jgi:predicted phosphodiesterase
MRIAVVHLSDIHIRQAGDPILARVDQIAAAVNSSDATAELFLIVISGDIAYSGSATEYALALKFFSELKEGLERLRKGVRVEYVCVPGNHDCMLPEADVNLRDILVRGVMSSMREGKQDPSLLAQVLSVQQPFTDFRNKLISAKSEWDGICEAALVEHGGKKIQVNLYNTAVLSRRKEQQGQLYVPAELLRARISLAKDAVLCLSVFHHSYLWIESDTATVFRNHVERTSDVALMGHQHYSHSFYKENDAGERVLYLEAGALQDEKYPKTSSFLVLTFDLDSQEEQSIKFRWAAKEQIYRKAEDSGWRALTLNRTIRADFRPKPIVSNVFRRCWDAPLAWAKGFT